MGCEGYESEATKWEPPLIVGGNTLNEPAVLAPSPSPNLRDQTPNNENPTRQAPPPSPGDPPYPRYPVPTPPEKQERAFNLYREYQAADRAEGLDIQRTRQIPQPSTNDDGATKVAPLGTSKEPRSFRKTQ